MDPEVTTKPFDTGAAESGQPVSEVQVPPSQSSPEQMQYESLPGFSAEDLSKAREQEKAKLYPQLERLKEENAALRRAAEERAAEEERARQEAEAEARKKAEAEMDVRELLQKKEQEWADQLAAERREREQALALLEMEKAYQELESYKIQRLENERDAIIPELVDLVAGNTREEIDASIENLKRRSNAILESAQTAMQNARRDMAGARVTVPASGPLDIDPDNKMITEQDVKSMSLSEYAKHRARLLGGAANTNRGLFG